MTTTSFGHHKRLSPHANVFLIVNLGCEMLYVIDQRLKAQHIAEEKSIQVIHDITAVLLEPKFIDSIIMGSTHVNAELLSAEHAKFMLKNIATCSLMRLDDISMDKLWNLMTVVYKWQLYLSKHQHNLLDITFRHLTEIGKMYTEPKRSMLIDFTKNTLLDFWNSFKDHEQYSIYHTNIVWLECFNTKISVLIRLGFQKIDGTFLSDVDCSYFDDFAEGIGENIYVKSVDVLGKQQSETFDVRGGGGGGGGCQAQNTARYDVNQLTEILCSQTTIDSEELKPIDAQDFQQQFEKNLKQCNVLFEDLDMSGGGGGNKCGNATTNNEPTMTMTSNTNGLLLDLQLFPDLSTKQDGGGEFVQLKPTYNNHSSDLGEAANASSAIGSHNHHHQLNLTKDLLDFYSNMN